MDKEPSEKASQVERAASGASEAGEGKDASVIELPRESKKIIGLSTAPVGRQVLKTTLAATGEIAADADREAHVTTRSAGRVTRVLKTVGDRVTAGQPLAILESVEIGQAQAELLEAAAKVELARVQAERQRRLFGRNLVAKREVQAAEHDLQLTEIGLGKVRNQLELLGFTGDRVSALTKNHRLDPTVPLLAPISGTIVSKRLTVGEMLRPDATEPAFTIADVSQLWVNANLYEKDLARVHEGQTAAVTSAAYPGHVYHGRVSLISALLDPTTRTAKARVVVDNSSGKLKPSMFVSVNLDIGTETALVVPRAAVQEENKQKIVYVPEGPDKFREVHVQLGREYPVGFQVLAGLHEGQPVVTHGSYDLLAQARKGAMKDND